MRHEQLHVLLGHGGRESGVRRHAGLRHDHPSLITMTLVTSRRNVVVALSLAVLFACVPPALASAQARPASVALRAENTLDISRAEETVGVPWSTLAASLPGARPN